MIIKIIGEIKKQFPNALDLNISTSTNSIIIEFKINDIHNEINSIDTLDVLNKSLTSINSNKNTFNISTITGNLKKITYTIFN